MTRKAILIGSPGSKNADNFLKGVDIDLGHFVSFLKSPIGGSWMDYEIEELNSEPTEKLVELVQNTHEDFLLLYFSGHGNQNLHETLIAINEHEAIRVSQLISIINSPKSLIIIDSCRKIVDEYFENLTGQEYLTFETSFNQPNTSELYKQKIAQCSDGIVIAYSCSVGEISNEIELGGLYTYSLLKTSLDWYVSQLNDGVLEISNVTNLAHQFVKRSSNNEQNPELIAVNNEQQSLNFPFALKITSDDHF